MHRAGCGFDPRRLHERQASVVSTAAHALCTAGVRVRILPEASYARSSVDESAVLRWRRPLVRPQPGISRADVAQFGRAPGRQPGSARSTRAVRLVPSTNPWCSGSTASSNLASPGSIPGGFADHDRRGPKWLGYLVTPSGAAVSNPHPDRISRPRRTTLLRAGTASGYRLLIERTRVRVPPGALTRQQPAPVAQMAERFRAVPTRPQQTSHIVASGTSMSLPACGPEQDGYRVERPARPGGGVFESRPEGSTLRSSGAHIVGVPVPHPHDREHTTTPTERRCTCRT